MMFLIKAGDPLVYGCFYYISACKIWQVSRLHKINVNCIQDHATKVVWPEAYSVVQLVMHRFLSLSATRVTTLWSWQPCFCGNRSFRLLVNWLYKSVMQNNLTFIKATPYNLTFIKATPYNLTFIKASKHCTWHLCIWKAASENLYTLKHAASQQLAILEWL